MKKRTFTLKMVAVAFALGVLGTGSPAAHEGIDGVPVNAAQLFECAPEVGTLAIAGGYNQTPLRRGESASRTMHSRRRLIHGTPRLPA